MRGGKTGFTNHARYCFVGSASRDGLMLTTVVLGSPSSADRFTSSRRLLEWGFKHYRIKQLCANTQSAGVLPISGTASQTVGVRYAKTVKQPVLDVLGPVARVPSLPTSTTVPVFAGQKLGVVRFVQAGTVLATVDAVASAPKASAEETVGTVACRGATRALRPSRGQRPVRVTVQSYDTSSRSTANVALFPSVVAPVAAGQVLGPHT